MEKMPVIADYSSEKTLLTAIDIFEKRSAACAAYLALSVTQENVSCYPGLC